ncbi:MAG: hypothetical protein ACFCUS_08495 [Rubrimonas sp.]
MADEAAQRRGGWLGDASSGAALGALVGLLLGLSVSEAVGGAVAALTALLGAFFGVAEGKLGALGAAARPARLIGFCLLCAGGVLGGVHLRATEALGPDPRDQLALWTALGAPEAEARALVVYQRLGLAPQGYAATEAAAPMAAARASALFSGEAGAACGRLDAPIYADAGALEAAMRDERGVWAEFAAALPQGLTPAQRFDVLRAAVALACR